MITSPKDPGISRKVHNIVASLVMADAERTLRDELCFVIAQTRSAHDIIEGGRKAMEALLLSDVLGSGLPIIDYMNALITEYIDNALRLMGDDVALTGCKHEYHTDTVYVETFRRIYRDADGIAVEYSDHLPEGTTPETFYGDYLDAFSLDELVQIAIALNKNTEKHKK